MQLKLLHISLQYDRVGIDNTQFAREQVSISVNVTLDQASQTCHSPFKAVFDKLAPLAQACWQHLDHRRESSLHHGSFQVAR